MIELGEVSDLGARQAPATTRRRGSTGRAAPVGLAVIAASAPCCSAVTGSVRPDPHGVRRCGASRYSDSDATTLPATPSSCSRATPADDADRVRPGHRRGPLEPAEPVRRHGVAGPACRHRRCCCCPRRSTYEVELADGSTASEYLHRQTVGASTPPPARSAGGARPAFYGTRRHRAAHRLDDRRRTAGLRLVRLRDGTASGAGDARRRRTGDPARRRCRGPTGRHRHRGGEIRCSGMPTAPADTGPAFPGRRRAGRRASTPHRTTASGLRDQPGRPPGGQHRDRLRLDTLEPLWHRQTARRLTRFPCGPLLCCHDGTASPRRPGDRRPRWNNDGRSPASALVGTDRLVRPAATATRQPWSTAATGRRRRPRPRPAV